MEEKIKKYRFIGEYSDYSFVNVNENNIYSSTYQIEEGFFVEEAVDVYPEDWELIEDEKNNINPTHYKGSNIQPIDLIESMKLDFRQGNIIKYVSRYKNKNGLEDLLKAQYYLERLIKELENETKT